MKNSEPCISKCKFKKHSVTTDSIYLCDLYEVSLKSALVKDEYDEGFVERAIKCEDCMEKELSNNIDTKVDEIRDMYNVFVYEMDLLMNELEVLKTKRRSIYE